MHKKRTYKSGFRTFEMDTLYYQSEYFRRFLKNYPEAVEELRELLPHFQSIFGSPVELDVRKLGFKTEKFDEMFLIQPDKLLPNYNDSSYLYQINTFKREPTVPDYIRMPDDSSNKGNEEWYKRVVETNIIWGIAELRAESGDSVLIDDLKAKQDIENKKREEYFQLAQKYSEDHSLTVTDSDLHLVAYRLTDQFFEENNLFQCEDIDALLKNYWEFYEKFHNWIAKYYLYRAWIRRSIFIALRRGLSSFWADIGSPIRVPDSLRDELYGYSEDDYLGFVQSDLPSPKPFHFKITRIVKGEKQPVTTNEKWQTKAYSLFYTPRDYEEKTLAEFKMTVDKVEFFEYESELVEKFYLSVKEALPDTAGNEELVKADFTEHLRRFPFLQQFGENRELVIVAFQKHIQAYLEELLPIISKHLRTNAGAPPKFDRIDWLLNWNIDNLTAREIVEKYGLSDDSTFWKAHDDLKLYNLPVKEKSSNTIDWNDDWFLQRMQAGFPDLKKLEKKKAKKN